MLVVGCSSGSVLLAAVEQVVAVVRGGGCGGSAPTPVSYASMMTVSSVEHGGGGVIHIISYALVR